MSGYHPGGVGLYPAMFAHDVYPYYPSAAPANFTAFDLSNNGTGKIDQIKYDIATNAPAGIGGAYLNDGTNSIPYSDDDTNAGTNHMPEEGQIVVYVMLEGNIPWIIGNFNDPRANSNVFNPKHVLGANVTKNNQNNSELQEGARTERNILAHEDKVDIRHLNSNIGSGVTGSDLNKSEMKVNENDCSINIQMDAHDEFIELSIQSGKRQYVSKIRMDGNSIYSYTHEYTVEAETFIEMFAGHKRAHMLMNKTNITHDIGRALIDMTKKEILLKVNTSKIDITKHNIYHKVNTSRIDLVPSTILQESDLILQNPKTWDYKKYLIIKITIYSKLIIIFI